LFRGTAGTLYTSAGRERDGLSQQAPLVLQPGALKPILAERCVQCHGPGNTLSEFDLTTRTSLLKGGKQGVDVVPGRPDESRLFQWVSAGKMPPGRKLEESEIASIREWIEQGARWGGSQSIGVERPRASLDWWSLQTPRKVGPPKLDGITNPIDAFVLAKLREKGLDFAPAADSRTLLRRLSFDLHGIVPKPELMSMPYERAIDYLLSSPEYGERWGRHWLDIVRFGETDGGEHNNERFTGWKYRYYVIAALKSDKPYDQFLREQIAGDVIAPDDHKGIAATGFLVAGPWDSVKK
jgi:mono/diheme cytochrome c family protein